MRTCYKCKVEKELTEFPKNGVTSYGKQVYKYKCKVCDYQRLKGRKKTVVRVKKIQKESISVWFWNLKQTYSCADCNISFLNQPYLCDFHHLDPTTKEHNVGSMYKYATRELILAEIQKCVPLCANCHRTRHYQNNVRELTPMPDHTKSPDHL